MQLSALFKLAFASASVLNTLTSLHTVTRRPVLQKVRHHTQSAVSACKHRVSGSLSLPSRGSFHLSLTVLYSIGHRIPRVLWYSGYTSPSRRFAYEALTLYGSTFQLYSTTTVRAKQCPYPALYFYMTVWALSLSLTTTQKIDSFLSLPPGTKMFQFPGFPSYTLCVQVSITQHYLR